MSWGSLALCPIPLNVHIHICTRAHKRVARVYACAYKHTQTRTRARSEQNTTGKYTSIQARNYKLYQNSYCFKAVLVGRVPSRKRREMLCVGSSLLSSMRFLRPVLLPFSGCSPLFVPAVRSLTSSSSSLCV